MAGLLACLVDCSLFFDSLLFGEVLAERGGVCRTVYLSYWSCPAEKSEMIYLNAALDFKCILNGGGLTVSVWFR
jgi:hypothetical protein